MQHDKLFEKIRFCADRLTPERLRRLTAALLALTLMAMPGCQHTSTDRVYETQRDLGKNSYTPRHQKDVKDLITLVHKPL